jgi:phosphopantothenoylcysteine decarboxylase/phosphopantothenate--cysteine ligase
VNILITAGGTREYIDPVRFISNASSGKMGFALARAALKKRHKVILITAPTFEKPPEEADILRVETSAQMFKAVKKHFFRCDCLIMAAAVTDYTAAHKSRTKIKRKSRVMNIKLKPTDDILKWGSKHKKKNQLVIGFALEDNDIRQKSEEKLKEKNLNMIIANTHAAIGADKTTVHIKTPHNKWKKIENKTKNFIAGKIIEEIEDYE